MKHVIVCVHPNPKPKPKPKLPAKGILRNNYRRIFGCPRTTVGDSLRKSHSLTELEREASLLQPQIAFTKWRGVSTVLVKTMKHHRERKRESLGGLKKEKTHLSGQISAIRLCTMAAARGGPLAITRMGSPQTLLFAL